MFGSVHSITSFDWSGVTDGPDLREPDGVSEHRDQFAGGAGGDQAQAARRELDHFGGLGVRALRDSLRRRIPAVRTRDGAARRRRGRVVRGIVLQLRKGGRAFASGRLQPFGTDRDGTVLGEGSALWMLETAESAEARGAKPLLEICGFGAAHDAHDIQAFRRTRRGRDVGDPAGAARGRDRTGGDRMRDRRSVGQPRRR